MTDWSRLAKLAGMLGSPHDGERLNAARLLQAGLDKEGITFGDLSERIAKGGIGAGFYQPPRVVYVDREVVRYKSDKPNPAAEIAHKILVASNGGRRLNSTERQFLRSICARADYTGGCFVLTTQQANWLSALQETYLSIKPKMKVYRTVKAKPVADDLLDEMGLASKEKDIEEAVGAFRSRASGERPQEKPKPDVRSAGQAPPADYRGDFNSDPVDDFDANDESPPWC